MDINFIIIKFFEIMISWPIASIIIVSLLRRDFFTLLNEFLLKVRNFSLRGLQFKLDNEVFLAQEEDSNKTLKLYLQKRSLSYVLFQEELNIREELEKHKKDCENLISQEEIINILISSYAETRLTSRLFSLDRNIPLTQKKILNFVNSYGCSCPKERLEEFYEEMNKKIVNTQIISEFEWRINQLLKYGLIEEEIYENYIISDMGQEYLRFLVTIGESNF